MTQKPKDDNRREREETFDEHYRRILSEKGKLEAVDVVYEQLKTKYEDYDETEAFIEYLRSVEKVFLRAEEEKWSIEKTEEEMIRGEIYVISQSTGIDENIFIAIYEEFKTAKHSVVKIQEIAQQLMEKYSNIEDCMECEDCREFIAYVKDSLVVFSEALHGNEDFDEIDEVKTKLIYERMKTIASSGKPPMEILKDIYNEFVTALKN